MTKLKRVEVVVESCADCPCCRCDDERDELVHTCLSTGKVIVEANPTIMSCDDWPDIPEWCPLPDAPNEVGSGPPYDMATMTGMYDHDDGN